MENRSILIDTSIIIDYIRAKQKENSLLYKLFKDDYEIFISAITTFEIYNGVNPNNLKLIEIIFNKLHSIRFNNDIAKYSIVLYNDLKSHNKIIEILRYFYCCNSINKSLLSNPQIRKHFKRIESLINLKKSKKIDCHQP
jgi:tRNA(fMet)-specific endonuclease VapC